MDDDSHSSKYALLMFCLAVQFLEHKTKEEKNEASKLYQHYSGGIPRSTPLPVDGKHLCAMDTHHKAPVGKQGSTDQFRRHIPK
jgi:hypothetical protein